MYMFIHAAAVTKYTYRNIINLQLDVSIVDYLEFSIGYEVHLYMYHTAIY